MKKYVLFFLSAAVVISFVLIGAHTTNAAEPGAEIGDIALQKGGELRGQLVDRAGLVKVDESVVIAREGKAIAIAKTDKQGRILIRGLSPGIYQIETAKTFGVYRLWATGTAPPKAQSDLLIVDDESIVRAQGESFGQRFAPAVRGIVVGGLVGGVTYWALDYNKPGT